jgi:hypothetical protein
MPIKESLERKGHPSPRREATCSWRRTDEMAHTRAGGIRPILLDCR